MTAPESPTPVENPAVTSVDPVVAPEASRDETSLPEWAKEELSKVKREAKNLRTRVHELEPLAQVARDLEEAQKTEAQKANDRAAELQQRLEAAELLAERNGLAATHGIPQDYFRFIVGSNSDERAESAAQVAELLKARNVAPAVVPAGPPPTGKPVEALQSGASPTLPSPPSTEYPAAWTPHVKRKE